MNNVLQLREGQEAIDAAHDVRENNLVSIFETGSFMFVGQSPIDGSIVFNAGPDLKIGDLAYMQKIFNIKCDDLMHSSMYKED